MACITVLRCVGGRGIVTFKGNLASVWKELLLPGAEVFLTAPGTRDRKTRYDLITVKKSNGLLINIDSQAPNKAAAEWLRKQPFDRIIPEYTFGDSRIDFYMEKDGHRFLMEVKDCTLERDGVGYFPDAPTERGIKHLRELAHAAGQGYHAILAFVIQMDGIYEVRANVETHPEFGMALDEARKAGVEIQSSDTRYPYYFGSYILPMRCAG